jgi:hypothetical protein
MCGNLKENFIKFLKMVIRLGLVFLIVTFGPNIELSCLEERSMKHELYVQLGRLLFWDSTFQRL